MESKKNPVGNGNGNGNGSSGVGLYSDKIELVREYLEDDPELEARMTKILKLDNKSKFVELVNNAAYEFEVAKVVVNDLFCYDAVKCAGAILAGDTGGNYDFKAICSHHGTTPLHVAALSGAFKLTNLLLENGENANARVDLKFNNLHQVLPLHLALSKTWNNSDTVWWSSSVWGHSPFRLICTLCKPELRGYLDVIRLLAQHTEEVDQEISCYLKKGRIEGCCALMLAGCIPPSTNLPYCEDDDDSIKEVKVQLMNIFQKIGDKLQAYFMLKRSPKTLMHDRVVMEIASLFRDAGLVVNCKESPMRWFGDFGKERMAKRTGAIVYDVNQGLAYKQAIGGLSSRSSGFAQTVRSFHSSSIMDRYKFSSSSTGLKGCAPVQPFLWRKSSFFMRALHNVIRYA